MILSVSLELLRNGSNRVDSMKREFCSKTTRKESWMESVKVFKLMSLPKPWIIYLRNWFALSKREELLLWLEWLKMSEEREKPKSPVEDKLSKSSETEKITYTKSSWAFTKDQLIHTSRMFSARQSIAHHLSRRSARLSSKHKLSTSSSIK